MFVSDKLSGRTAACDGIEYLFFSGTAYLGMNNNPAFKALIGEGFERYGNSYGSSRNSNFQLKIYEEAESKLAMYAGAEAALTVSSGYMAGQLTINTFKNKGHFIFAPGTHPAVCIEPGNFYPGDFKSWSTGISKIAADLPEQDISIVCNSLDPLYCILYDFEWTRNLPANKNITLIVDDSHGLGVTGDNGSGIYKKIDCSNNVNLVVISSLGKAMGIPGGVIFSTRNTVELLRRTSFFSAASPAPPAYLYAFTQSDPIYSTARKQLSKNITTFKELLSSIDIFNSIKDYPVFYTSKNELYTFLAQRKILVSSFAYPKADGDIITRIILNSNHTDEDIQALLFYIHQFLQLN